jgi:hypothetical protein
MLGPFLLALVVALAQVSGTMGVQAVDPVLHAFQAKVYLHDGMFRPVGPDQVILHYPSGFAAVNAVTTAVSFLTPVQAVNLQHILWIITGLFLTTGTIAAWTRRPLTLLHATALPFLVLFPIYGLFPDYGYSGTPRQMAPPLLLAVVLLPALAPRETRGSRIAVIAISMFLAVLTLALNPICAPFTLAAIVAATVIYAGRRPHSLRQAALSATSFAIALGLATVLVLGTDQHYASYLTKPAIPAAPSEAGPELPPVELSASAALQALRSVNALDLTPTVMLAEEAYPNPAELHWTERFPQRLAPWLAEALTMLALVLVARRRGEKTVPGVRAVALLLLGCAAMWLLLKCGVAVATGGVAGSAWKAQMFQVYLKTSLTRMELLLLFTSLAASTTLIVLMIEGRRPQLLARLAPLGWLAIALLTVGLARGPDPKSGHFSVPAGSAYSITAEDRELARWADENLPFERGLIGLAATTYTWGPEKHVYALNGGQAIVQYGKHENFRFGLRALERNEGYDEYIAHVRDRFDAAWCRANNIRFFYVDSHSLKWNTGLAHAIAAGELKMLRQVGDSAIYEVVGGDTP